METLPATQPVLFCSANGALLHGVALPSALLVLEADHPCQAWLERLAQMAPQSAEAMSMRQRVDAMLDFVPPLPLDFPTPNQLDGCVRGLALREWFKLAEPQQLWSWHTGGGEALHLVDYVAYSPAKLERD